MKEALSPQDCRVRYGPQMLAELARIEEQGHSTSDDRQTVALDQQSIGRLSRMDALQGQAMAKAMQVRRDARALALRAALVRLEGEDFGWCEDCGEFIGVARLDLDPASLRCVDCAR